MRPGRGASGYTRRMRFVESETIETARLRLRAYGPGDEPASVALMTDAEVMRHVGDGAMTPERAARVFRKIFELYETGAWGIWAIEERASGRFAGGAEIKPRTSGDWEIVYVLARDSWGKGYATEVASALVAFGLGRMKLPRVVATVAYDNAPSIRVLEKVGMRRVGEESDEIGPYAVYATGE